MEALTEADPPRDARDPTPFDARLDVFVMSSLLKTRHERGVPPWRLALAGPVLIALAVGVAIVEGTLLPTGGWATVVSDLRHMVLGEPPASADISFPLLRDYPTLVLYTLMGFNFAVLYRQWSAMEAFLPRLLVAGTAEVRDEAAANAAFNQANSRLERMAQARVFTAAVACVVVALIVSAHRRSGVFGAFAPPRHGREWALSAYEHWWAGPSNLGGFVTYLLIAAGVVYYILVQNLVGGVYVLLYLRSADHLTFRFDLLDRDGWHGWAPFRTLMQTVVLSITVHATALSVLFHVVSPEQALLLSPLLVVFTLFNWFYLIPPLLLVRKVVKQAKAGELERLAHLVSADAEGELGEWSRLERRSAVRREMRRVREVPSWPFRFRGLLLGICLYLTPVVAAALQLLQIWTQDRG